MRRIALFLFCACVGSTALSAPRPRLEIVTGQVVAYTTPLSCLNGNGYWGMIVRVRQPERARLEFVRVDFSLPCGATPDWVSGKPQVRKFRLERNKDCDAALEQFMHAEPKQDLAIPLWKQAPGTEPDTLPYGQMIPCYHSVDMPLAPVL